MLGCKKSRSKSSNYNIWSYVPSNDFYAKNIQIRSLTVVTIVVCLWRRTTVTIEIVNRNARFEVSIVHLLLIVNTANKPMGLFTQEIETNRVITTIEGHGAKMRHDWGYSRGTGNYWKLFSIIAKINKFVRDHRISVSIEA